MEKYNHKDIEKKWQKIWEEEGIYKIENNSSKPKQYILDMFPYPSGEGLHVGHPRGYIATDVFSRMKRMQGNNILHSMGWDAFGLPAENFAIKNKIHPRVAVEKNVTRFKEQLSLIGFDYDWSHEINTTDPKFYKWTQWIFLQMFKKGLAYESNEPINWCPSCQTGLANEDVNSDGTCERCGTKVEKKPMRQWVLKITDYADRMLADLDKLPKWPEGVKEAQRNWIGKSEGTEIDFRLKGVGYSEKISNVVILHGCGNSVNEETGDYHDSNWKTWLEKRLISNGMKVERPIMHSSQKPVYELWKEKIESLDINENSILVGHSCGGSFLVRWLLETKKEVAKLILVAPAKIYAEDSNDEKKRFYDFEVGNSLNETVKDIVIFTSPDERPRNRESQIEIFHKILGGKLYDLPNYGHYRTLEFPELLNEIIPSVKVFTTRPDTIFGATFIAISAGLAKDWIGLGWPASKEITDYIEQTLKEEAVRDFKEKEKTGIYAGFDAINPATKELIPVWITNYVLKDIGTGAIMAVPAHDERDFEFAARYKIPVRQVVSLQNNAEDTQTNAEIKCFTEYGVVINSGEFDGLTTEEAKKKITEFVGGKMMSTYRIKDWIFSRQRYWGEPIPLIHCEKCGVVPVPEKDLPVLLPEVENYEPAGTGESPLANISDWVNVECPTCNDKAKRETNTMPQWAGSSWYYLRYINPNNEEALVDKAQEKEWMPVDVYVGGDHATRHLIYARFWHKFLFDIGVVSTEEPFPRLEFLGFILAEDGRKMSKRWKNVVTPDEMVERFGADSFRLFEMFIGPFESTAPWNTDGLVGTSRFLEKVWRLKEQVDVDKKTCRTDGLVEKTIKGVGEDIENFKFNTAISKMMILTNALEKEEKITERTYKVLLQILSPFAPHMTEELYQSLGIKNEELKIKNFESIHKTLWPKYDESKVVDEEFELVVQVNGKKRDSIIVKNETSEDDIKKMAIENESVIRNIEGKEILKVVIVPKRLINIVVK